MNSVVVFHAVTDGRWFESVIDLLQARYSLCPIEYLADFYDGGDVRNACHITVDDGHRSFYDVVWPVLKRRRVNSSLFVSPLACMNERNFWFQEIVHCDEFKLRQAAAQKLGVPMSSLESFDVECLCKALPIRQIEEILRMSRRESRFRRGQFQNMTVKELQEVAKSGLVTIGAHSMSHPVLKNEDDEVCRYEIDRSIAELSSLLDAKVAYFAYPNGIPGLDFTEREEALLASSGAKFAFSTESRHVALTDRRMSVPRIQITQNESLTRIQAKLNFSAAWNLLKKWRPEGEYSKRGKLSDVLSASASGSGKCVAL